MKNEIFYSLRVLLPKSSNAELFGGGLLHDSKLVRRVTRESLSKLEEEKTVSERSIRWELGSCWVQHLQKQETPDDNNSSKNPQNNKAEPLVKGLGKQFKMLKKREKKTSAGSVDDCEEIDSGESIPNVESCLEDLNNGESNHEEDLKKLISEEAFSRLKESGTGLHFQVCNRLVTYLELSVNHLLHRVPMNFHILMMFIY